jgi:2-C-methyl-D-erythritol 4-phosphate cytidylyltransferase
MKVMKKFAIIVAGGSGSRMGSEIPKQFLDLCGKPVLMHTLQVFFDFDPQCQLILVLPLSQQNYWIELCRKYSFELPLRVVQGGETRFHSVKNGLELVDDAGIVFIHDGVRPLVNTDTLERCLKTSMQQGNAIPVLPVTESLRKKEGNSTISVDRTLYLSVQTPQTFRSEQIMEAFRQTYDPAFTDDASVAEKAGFPIFMVEGNHENIKITTPTDLIIAEAFLRKQKELH